MSHVLTIGRLNALGINSTAPFQSVFSQDSPIYLRFSPAIFCRGASSARLHGMNQMFNFVDSSLHASGLRKLASCREPNSQNPYYQYEMRGPL